MGMKFRTLFLNKFSPILLSGSLVMVIGSLAAGAANYLYHLIMGRILGPTNYGLLESLISLLYLLGIPTASISLVVVKYISYFKGQKRWGAIGKFYLRLSQNLFHYGLIGIVGFLLVMPFIARFLHLDSPLILLVIGAIGLLSVYSGINRAVLQGLSRFAIFNGSLVIEAVGKLIFSLLLVIIGYQVNGAIAGILLGVILGYFFSRFFVGHEVAVVDLKENLGRKAIIRYLGPVVITMFSFTSLFTADVIFARHFLAGYEAGLYAASSTLAKIIYFTTGPIAMALFPLVSEHQSRGKKHHHLFLQSLFLVGFAGGGLVIFYALFANHLVNILFGQKFLEAASYLWLFAIFISFYSLSFLGVNYYLSLGRTAAVALAATAAVSQIALIVLFHQTLFQIVFVSLLVSGLLFAALMLYYWSDEGKKSFSFGNRSRL